MSEFRWKPFSKKQIKVLTWWMPQSPVCDRFGIIADGAIRSGKTVCMSLSFVLWAMHNFDGFNFAICGKTIASVRRNVIFELVRSAQGRGFKVTEQLSQNRLIVSKGSRSNRFYLFGGKDESSAALIQGMTLAGVLFDEAALMPQSFVDQAAARCSVKGARLWFNCNPQGPTHWFKREWIDKAAEKNLVCLSFSMDDNLSLDEATKERYCSLYSGVFYERFILGKWSAADGLIYDMFDRSRHVLHTLPALDERAPAYISCDYGTLNACVFLLWRKALDGRWICVREYYYSGRDKGVLRTDEEYAKDMQVFIGDERIRYVIADPSAASFITRLKRDSLPVLGAKNDVMTGIHRVSSLLHGGDIAFMDSCQNTIDEFGSYIWDRKAADRGEDAPMKQSDHAMDAVRYFVNTVLGAERRVGTSGLRRMIGI